MKPFNPHRKSQQLRHMAAMAADKVIARGGGIAVGAFGSNQWLPFMQTTFINLQRERGKIVAVVLRPHLCGVMAKGIKGGGKHKVFSLFGDGVRVMHIYIEESDSFLEGIRQ